MRKHIATILKITCSALLVLFLISRVDWCQARELITPGVIPYFAASVCITLCALALQSIRWRWLLTRYVGIEADQITLYRYYLIGSFFNILLPGAIGGDVVRTERIVRMHDANLKRATATTIVERLAGIYGLGFMLSISIVAGNFPTNLEAIAQLPLWLRMLCPVAVLAVLPVLNLILKRYDLQCGYLFMGKVILCSLTSQMGDILIAWLMSMALGMEIGLSAFIFVMPLVYVATVIPISLGGLGVREGTFSGLMVLYGAEPSTAILISIMMYLVKVCIGIIGYCVYMASGGRKGDTDIVETTDKCSKE